MTLTFGSLPVFGTRPSSSHDLYIIHMGKHILEGSPTDFNAVASIGWANLDTTRAS